MDEWIDITRPVDETLLTWPGRGRPTRRWEKSLEAGDHCNVSAWDWNAHSGTHMDAPLHFEKGGKAIDQIPAETFFGPCQVVELAQAVPLDAKAARPYEGARRLLVRTAHSRLPPGGEYEPHDILMTEEAAKMLLDGGLALIGTDRLSVDDFPSTGYRLHHLFLGANCVIVEGLLLGGISPGSFSLAAAPLRLSGAEASPVRAFLRRGTGK